MKKLVMWRAGVACLGVLVLVTGTVAMHYRNLALTHERQADSEPRDAARADAPERSVRDEPPGSNTREGELAAARMRAEELRMRVTELEEALQNREEELAELRRARQEEPLPTGPEAPRRRPDWAERMQELREHDPERYAEIQQRRADMRQRVHESFARKAAHFLYRDNVQMTEAEREEFDSMLGMLSETWELAKVLEQEDLPAEVRRTTRRELMRNVRDLQPMLEAERDREFHEVGLQLGYDEQGAEEFVEYINEMIEISSFVGIWRGARGGRREGAGRQED